MCPMCSPVSGRKSSTDVFDIQAGNQVGENFWKMLLAEHGLDHTGVCRHFPSRFQVQLGAEPKLTDLPWHRPIAARAGELPRFSFPFPFFFSKLFWEQRWRRTSRRSTRDRRPSMSRVAYRSTSRLVSATGCAPALLARCSSRTRSSMVKAEPGTIGRKAVRIFSFPSLFPHSCSSCLFSLH